MTLTDEERRDMLHNSFLALVEDWKTKTKEYSEPIIIITHPSFRKMLRMGNEVIPFIVEELKENPDNKYWAFALNQLSRPQEDMLGLPEEDAPQEVSDWLEWSRKEGLLS